MKSSLASAFIVVVWLAVVALRTDPTRADNAAIAAYRPNMSEIEQARLLNDADNNSCPKDDDNTFNQADWPEQANGTRASLVRQRYTQSNYLISSAGIIYANTP